MIVWYQKTGRRFTFEFIRYGPFTGAIIDINWEPLTVNESLWIVPGTYHLLED